MRREKDVGEGRHCLLSSQDWFFLVSSNRGAGRLSGCVSVPGLEFSIFDSRRGKSRAASEGSAPGSPGNTAIFDFLHPIGSPTSVHTEKFVENALLIGMSALSISMIGM